jgi:hypothetical protein
VKLLMRFRWHALFRVGHEAELIQSASLKLTNGRPFNSENADHVIAVLSQRLCVDTVFVGSEALELADRSVANHMRLLTGFSSDQRTFYTYSPSEPMLALAAAHLLYWNDCLGRVLDTFSRKLCQVGLIEKSIMGELGGRTLLMVARDLAAPPSAKGNNLKTRAFYGLFG